MPLAIPGTRTYST